MAVVTQQEMELTEDVVELVMRLLLCHEIDRTVACRFVAPWVEGTLPSSSLAESGAQTIHGLDIVRHDGLALHPLTPDADNEFAVDDDELARRCHEWLRRAGRCGT